MTHINDITNKVLQQSDEILGGKHFLLNPDVFTLKVGSIVTHKESGLIGTLYGYMASPFNGGSTRAILGSQCDVSLHYSLTEATEAEKKAYLLFTKDMEPVSIRMTCYFGSTTE